MINDLISDEVPSEGWLVQDLVAEDGITLLRGYPKTFKSFIALDLALSIASGRSFHGHPAKRGRVCIISGHGGIRVLSRRVRSWCDANGVTNAELDALLAEDVVHLDDPQDVARLSKLIANSCSLVVFDTLSDCTANYLWKIENAEKAIEGCRSIQATCQAAVMLVQYDMIQPTEPRLPQNILNSSRVILTATTPELGKCVILSVTKGPYSPDLMLVPDKKGGGIAHQGGNI